MWLLCARVPNQHLKKERRTDEKIADGGSHSPRENEKVRCAWINTAPIQVDGRPLLMQGKTHCDFIWIKIADTCYFAANFFFVSPILCAPLFVSTVISQSHTPDGYMSRDVSRCTVRKGKPYKCVGSCGPQMAPHSGMISNDNNALNPWRPHTAGI